MAAFNKSLHVEVKSTPFRSLHNNLESVGMCGNPQRSRARSAIVESKLVSQAIISLNRYFHLGFDQNYVSSDAIQAIQANTHTNLPRAQRRAEGSKGELRARIASE